MLYVAQGCIGDCDVVFRDVLQCIAKCDLMCDAMRCDAMRCDAMRCDAMRCDANSVHAMIHVYMSLTQYWLCPSMLRSAVPELQPRQPFPSHRATGVRAHCHSLPSCLDIGALQGFKMVRRAVRKAHRTPNSTREAQLTSDRRQTRAISLYLHTEREKLLEHLRPGHGKSRFAKRNELVRMARSRFKALPGHEQKKYTLLATQKPAIGRKHLHALATSKAAFWKGVGELGRSHITAGDVKQESGAEAQEAGFNDTLQEMLELDVPIPPQACASQESAHRSTRFRIKVKRPDIGIYGLGQPASPPAECTCTPSPRQSQVWESGSLGVESWGHSSHKEAQPTAVKSVLRDRLMDVAPQPLRELYGDAGCMEVLAASLRILDVAEESLMCMSGAVVVKLAAVLGVAAKLSQTSAIDQHIVKLWARIAKTKLAEKQIRDMENKVISMWVKPCLGSDSFLHKMK